jgi:hypothetical protein
MLKAVLPALLLLPVLVLPQTSWAQEVPVPAVDGPVTGPGAIFPGLREVPPGTTVEAMGYEAKEYFVSGTAAGKPYTTRIVVRSPREARRASGMVVAEAMHGSGNSWMFFMTRIYMMREGHVHVEIAAQKAPTEASIIKANPERYKTLSIPDAGQVNEIIAQVGALLKSPKKPAPLAALDVRKLFLMGTSQSAGVLRAYLPLHATHRLPGGAPIYDGYYPTSTGGEQQVLKVDVPLVQLATQTEVNAALATGHKYRREDGDDPGNQFRLYEVAGMPHNDSRENPTYRPNDPCINPSTTFPVGAMMSVGLNQLIRWVDTGSAPPRAPRVEVSGNQMILDEHGNVKGGVRNTYVDVPTSKLVVPNKGKPGLPAEVRADFYCNIAGYEEPMSANATRALYGDKTGYQRKVEARLKDLTRQGWFLPVYETQVLSDAADVKIP